MFGGRDFQVSPKLSDPGAHPRQTYSETGDSVVFVPSDFRRHAMSLVFHLKDNAVVLRSNTNSRGLASGVTVDVGKAFLQYTKQSKFHVGR